MKRTTLSTTPMERLAQRVCDKLVLGEWGHDIVTREIGTADTFAQALRRLENLVMDIATAKAVMEKWRKPASR